MTAIDGEVALHLLVLEKARLPCGYVGKALGVDHPCERPEQSLDDEGVGAQAQLKLTIARLEDKPGVACAAFYFAIIVALFLGNLVQVIDEA